MWIDNKNVGKTSRRIWRWRDMDGVDEPRWCPKMFKFILMQLCNGGDMSRREVVMCVPRCIRTFLCTPSGAICDLLECVQSDSSGTHSE